MTPSFVAFPGTVFSSKSHYIVFLKGDTPVTSRLLKPALIDAETGTVLFSKDEDAPVPPASLAKLMTMQTGATVPPGSEGRDVPDY